MRLLPAREIMLARRAPTVSSSDGYAARRSSAAFWWPSEHGTPLIANKYSFFSTFPASGPAGLISTILTLLPLVPERRTPSFMSGPSFSTMTMRSDIGSGLGVVYYVIAWVAGTTNKHFGRRG